MTSQPKAREATASPRSTVVSDQSESAHGLNNCDHQTAVADPSDESGLTLIELVVMILIISVVATLVGVRVGTFRGWEQQGFLRRFSETVVFLHHQAVTDQVFYRLTLDFDNQNYRVHQIQTTNDESKLGLDQSESGSLSNQLAAMLNPSVGENQQAEVPSNFPSLAEPVSLPIGIEYEDVRSMRGEFLASDGGSVYLYFSPRGFSEFAVIHLRQNGAPLTILVNPFTGTVQLFKEYREYEWTYGRKQSSR